MIRAWGSQMEVLSLKKSLNILFNYADLNGASAESGQFHKQSWLLEGLGMHSFPSEFTLEYVSVLVQGVDKCR